MLGRQATSLVRTFGDFIMQVRRNVGCLHETRQIVKRSFFAFYRVRTTDCG